jgi:hypothetical protein
VIDYFEIGFLAEKRFIEHFKDAEIKIADKDENMYGHWDVSINGYKVDVKGAKKVNRHDDISYNYNWLELKNVRGNKGWLLGDADYIAFETDTEWMVADRFKLLNELLIRMSFQPAHKKPFHPYTRAGREDVVVLVPNSFIREYSKCIKKQVSA